MSMNVQVVGTYDEISLVYEKLVDLGIVWTSELHTERSTGRLKIFLVLQGLEDKGTNDD